MGGDSDIGVRITEDDLGWHMGGCWMIGYKCLYNSISILIWEDIWKEGVLG